jgi:hypothetical protein
VAVEVELRPGSDAERQVSAAAKGGGRMTPEVTALVARLAAGTRPPPVGGFTGGGALVLKWDVAALTRELVERLGKRPDVEYAQPSHLVKPTGDAR